MINEDVIRRWWDIFVKDNGFTEVRILGKFQYSGYFNNVDNLIECIKPYSEMEDEQIYFVMNKIDEACYGRQQCEKIVKGPKQTTSDDNITRREYVLLDFDPKRPAGVNATDEEFEFAHKKAQDVFAYLRENGFNDPIICKSGNGWHCILKCDMENTEETRDLISRFLQSMAIMFNDERIDIDEAVFNASRICKLYGTTAKKGANLKERPWRMSDIVYVPKEIKVNDKSLFEKIANMLPKEEPKPIPQYNGNSSPNEPFDLEKFLNQHSISYKREACSKWTKYVLDHCFFNPEHRGKDAAIIQMQSGAIKYTCLHNSCQHHTWQEMRQMLDPTAYMPKNDYRPQEPRPQRPIQQQPQKPKYNIKEELPELGKKWLCMSDIKKIDLSALSGSKTGFTELDRQIIKLYDGEVSILTGSNASGKSSLLNTLICNLLQQNVKSSLWSGELPKEVLKSWIQMVAAGRKNLRLSNYGDGKYYVPNDIGERIDSWMDGRFFLFNNDYGNTWAEIKHDMTELLKAGVKVFILDNLFSLDIDLFEGDKNNKQKEVVLEIKEFAKKNHVHIILVAHPRKTIAFLRKHDISGTSDLQNAVDNIFIIHRVNQDFFRVGADYFGQAYIQKFQGFGNVIEVAKNRMWGVVDSMVGLHYEIESRRFKNTMDEEIIYGWMEQPRQVEVSFPQSAPEQSMPMPTANANVNDRNYGGESREIDFDDSVPFAPPAMDDDAPF